MKLNQTLNQLSMSSINSDRDLSYKITVIELCKAVNNQKYIYIFPIAMKVNMSIVIDSL